MNIASITHSVDWEKGSQMLQILSVNLPA